MQPYRHLSDLRTALLLRARSAVASDEIISMAEACADVLSDAHRLLGEHAESPHLADLLLEAGASLDELDERLLVLPHDEDRAVFSQLELLRDTLNNLGRQRPRSEGR